MSDRLITLRISHAWCEGQAVPGLTLTPDGPTAALLRRYDITPRMAGRDWSLDTGRVPDPQAVLGAMARALEGQPLRFRFGGDLAGLAAVTALPAGLVGFPSFSSGQYRADGVADPADRSLIPVTDGTVPLGEVWLYPDDLARAPAGTVWSIRFDARRLPWIFFVVNRSGNTLHQPFVRDSDGQVLDGPEAVTLPDGEAALRFDTGDRPLPLSRVPALRFGLFDRVPSPLSDRSSDVCLLRSLPLPRATSTIWDGAGAARRIGAAATVYL